MMNMEIKEGTGVFTTGDKQVGQVNRFVIDPSTNEITHIVVQKGWLFTEDKVVPIERVQSATEDKVVLNEEESDFDQLPPFEETHFFRVDDERANMRFADDYPTGLRAPVYYWYPPHGYTGSPAYGLGYGAWPPAVTERNIPQNTVPLKEGANVMSADDKHVGAIERVFIEGDSNRATHFLISQGTLFKDRKLVPAHWVRAVDEDTVNLTVSSEVLEDLPSYEDE